MKRSQKEDLKIKSELLVFNYVQKVTHLDAIKSDTSAKVKDIAMYAMHLIYFFSSKSKIGDFCNFCIFSVSPSCLFSVSVTVLMRREANIWCCLLGDCWKPLQTAPLFPNTKHQPKILTCNFVIFQFATFWPKPFRCKSDEMSIFPWMCKLKAKNTDIDIVDA